MRRRRMIVERALKGIDDEAGAWNGKDERKRSLMDGF